jgi:hypothetical protein
MADENDNKTTEEQQTQGETGNPTVSDELSKEIDAGVESAMVEVEKDRQEREAAEGGDKPGDEDTLPPGETRPGEEAGSDASGDGKQQGDEPGDKPNGDKEPGDAVTDELLERAVKAGLSLEEAKRYPDASMLGHVCDRLEELSRESGSEGDQAGDGQGGDKPGENDNDPLASFPEFVAERDGGEYDNDIADAMNAMKGIVRQQQETINGLQAAGKDSEKSWFDSKVSGLGKAFDTALEKAPEKRTALKEQFDVLEAGYKASGKEVEQDAIFDQAVAITLGDVKAKAATDAKTEQLRDREGKFISRPGGTNTKPTTDAYEDTAAEIDSKFFGKK